MTILMVIALVIILLFFYALYKLKNYLVLIASFATPILIVAINNQRICLANSYSEACTWAYLGYIPAILGGVVIYLFISAYQAWFKSDSTS